MTKQIVRIYIDADNFIDRGMTDEEVAQNIIDIAATDAANLERHNSALAKAALLERLGITADEAALLLS